MLSGASAGGSMTCDSWSISNPQQANYNDITYKNKLEGPGIVMIIVLKDKPLKCRQKIGGTEL
jgi:hypothetical protein